MTTPPEPAGPVDPARVAELEQQLAHVMAELSRAKGDQPASPSYEPYVPGASRPETPQVTVDGEQVEPGTGRFSEALRSGGFVVQVNGHTVSSGEADLSSLDPRLVEDLQQTFRMLGMEPPGYGPQEEHVGSARRWPTVRAARRRDDATAQPAAGFGPHLPGPGDVDRLGEGPRPVPLTHRLAVGNLSPVGLFVLFMVAVSPLALWILVPWALAAGLLVGSLALGARIVSRYLLWVPVLREGEVAQVTAAVRSTTSTSFTNVPLRRARGWDARWQAYTGQGYRTEVSYTVAGSPGTLVVFGAPYDGGVVLADPRRPARALCVSQLPFSVHPDQHGQLRGGLPVFGWVSMLLTLGAEVTMLGLLVALLL